MVTADPAEQRRRLTAQVEHYLWLGHELRGFEVKGSGARGDNPLLVKVVRALLGLGNLRDGGLLVIGIDDKQMAAMQPGLNEAQARSWMEYDQLASTISKYSDPPVELEPWDLTLSNGNRVVVIEVKEFQDYPHLCLKDYSSSTSGNKPILREGALYIRKRGMPATTEFASSIEMREIIDLAVAKQRIRDYTAERRAPHGA